MDPIRVLIVEDEANLAKVVRRELESSGWEITVSPSGEDALEMLDERFDAVLLDLNLPGISGMDVFKTLVNEADAPEVVILTGNGDVGNAVAAMKLGAYDYLEKPVSLDRLQMILGRAAEKCRLRLKNILFRKQAEKESQFLSDVVVIETKMKRIFHLAEKVAGTDASILILGETGTGKDVLANYIHRVSDRADGPFISINCASLQGPTLENELFGHEKGAFTDARERKPGFFEIASSGTIFLDEINEMAPGIQAKLLHVLEKGTFYRVGGTRLIQSRARIITATNRDLEKGARDGTFRPDLYYRINMFSLCIPPLRERPMEIVPLAMRFLQEINSRKTLLPRTQAALLGYKWPGNVRELKHAIQRGAIIAAGDGIEPRDVLPVERNDKKGRFLWDALSLEEMEAVHIEKVLESVAWKRSVAAEILGIDVKTLYRKVKKYGLKPTC